MHTTEESRAFMRGCDGAVAPAGSWSLICSGLLTLALGLVVGGCECANGSLARSCTVDGDCASGRCVAGMCRSGPGPTTDGGPPVSSGDCRATPPRPGTETCNMVDDDCDGTADEGVLSSCGDCDPSCTGDHLDRGDFDPDTDDAEGVGLDTDGALILDTHRIETAFIWIANTGEGTVSKVDTRTRTEVARYRTGPGGGAEDPSRTSVNSLGDVYVANRAGQSVTKISVLGDDCPDTNGDGVITTSHGPTEVLPWGQDDCVLWRTALPGGGILRALAAQDTLGPDGEVITAVWVGGWEGVTWKLDGETGGVLVQTASPTNNYGFALDGRGNLWISGRSARALGRIDTRRCVDTASCDVPVCGADGADCIKQAIPVPSSHNPYGITVDAEQRVWIAMHGTSSVGRYDPMAAGDPWTFVNIGTDPHGIAADGAGWIWVAGWGAGVVRITADDPTAWTLVPGTGGFNSKGMAVDFDGFVWSINQGTSDATVIEPGPTLMEADVFTGVVRHGALRYTYSDMTGTQLRLATDPRGRWRRPFEGCTDETRTSGTIWRELRFTGGTPDGTLMRFRARTAATRAELADATWVLIGETPPSSSPLDVAAAFAAAGVMPLRWIEVEVQLEAMRVSTTETPITPRLTSLTVTRECPPRLD